MFKRIAHDIKTKTLAVICAGFFLFTNTVSWAEYRNLAPETKFDISEFRGSLTAAAICKYVEHDGKLNDQSYLKNVLARLDAENDHNIVVLPHEITIEIPAEGLAVRYFDPVNANVITPFSDVSELSTKVINPLLNRQVIRRIKALPKVEEKCLFGKIPIPDLEILLKDMSQYEFPKGDEFCAPGYDTVITFKDVIQSQPHPKYQVPLFTDGYTDSVYAIQYAIYSANRVKGCIDLDGVIAKYFTDEEQTKINVYKKDKDEKAIKMFMLRILWEREHAIKKEYKDITLLKHAENEWEIINALVNGRVDFKGATSNPRINTVNVLKLYDNTFGSEFSSLKGNTVAFNFMAHLLLIHDLGKYSLGEEFHEKRSEAILEKVFNGNYFHFSGSEKDVLRGIIGIHAGIERLETDASIRESFNRIINKAASSAEFADKSKLLDIMRIWMVFRIAECVQAADFGFADEGYFERLKGLYDNAKEKINEIYAEKASTKVTLPNGMEIKLRPLTKKFAAEHIADIRKLMHAIPKVHWTDEQILADQWDAVPAKGYKEKKFWAKWEQSIVALDSDGNPVGLILAYEKKQEEDETKIINRGSLYVNGFSVNPIFRKQGLGKILMQRLAKNFMDKGFLEIEKDMPVEKRDKDPIITLRFERKSEYLAKVYKNLGFEIVGTIDAYDFHNDYVCVARPSVILDGNFTKIAIIVPRSLKGGYGNVLLNGFKELRSDNVTVDLLMPEEDQDITEFAKEVKKRGYDFAIVNLHGEGTEKPVVFEDYGCKNVILVHRSVEAIRRLGKGMYDMEKWNSAFSNASSVILLGPSTVKEYEPYSKNVQFIPHGFSAISNSPVLDKHFEEGVAIGSSTLWAEMRSMRDVIALVKEVRARQGGEKAFGYIAGPMKSYTDPETGKIIDELSILREGNDCVFLTAETVKAAYRNENGFNDLASFKKWLFAKSENGRKVIIVEGDLRDNKEVYALEGTLIDFSTEMYHEIMEGGKPKIEYSGAMHRNPGTKIAVGFESGSMKDMEEEGINIIPVGYKPDGTIDFSYAAQRITDYIRNPGIYYDRLKGSWEKARGLTNCYVAGKYFELSDQVTDRNLSDGMSRKFKGYMGQNRAALADTLNESNHDILVRVPVEVIQTIDTDLVKGFFRVLNGNKKRVELFYMSLTGYGEVSEGLYRKYGLKYSPLELMDVRKRTCGNTITLFAALKGEDIDNTKIRQRLGNVDMTVENTVLSPIGIQNDAAGLIRATVFGLRMMEIARKIKEPLDRLRIADAKVYAELKDKVQQVLEVYKTVCDPDKIFHYTPQDIDDLLGLIAGDVNCAPKALNKLVQALPITPIDAEMLSQIFERAKEVLQAA